MWFLKKALISILFVFISFSQVNAQTVTLTWDAPTTNDDGTELTDLKGFIVYRGFVPRSVADYTIVLYVDLHGASPVGAITYSYDVTSEGDNYWGVTAYNEVGEESDYSNEVTLTISILPNPPNNLQCSDE